MTAATSPSPFEPEFPLGLRVSEIKTSTVAWGVYLGAMIAYCILYQAVVIAVAPDFAGTITIALREWGAWLVTTPIAFRTFRQLQERKVRRIAPYLRAGVLLVLAAAAVPVAIDYLTDARALVSSAALFIPRYVAALIVVYLVWHVFLRSRVRMPQSAETRGVQRGSAPQEVGQETRQAAAQEIHLEVPRHAPAAAVREYPDSILVSKGSDECLIPVNRIECISAAGNYVEIHARGQLYLLRATMKQVDEMLPPTQFVRVHRSHIANRDEIERIKTLRSGNGTVHLRSGKVLSMSKKYRAELNRFRPRTEAGSQPTVH